MQSRKRPADIASTPNETPTQRDTRRRDGASESNRCAIRAAGNSALPILAGAAAGAALRDSTNRVPQQSAAQQSADTARRASQTETKRRQRAKRSQQQVLAERVANTTARAAARARAGQVRAERAAAAEAERAAAAAAMQHARHVLWPTPLPNPDDFLTRAAIAINLLGFHSQFLQQEPSSLSQLSQQPIAPRAGTSG
ncbi:TPA: hypothetical protein ACH3X2_001445 [Trebouxia sp. C0005]